MADDGTIEYVNRYYMYDTENGGIFYVKKSSKDDNIRLGIAFQSTENVPYGKHEEFIKPFMEKANLKHYEIGNDFPRETMCMISTVILKFIFFGNFLMVSG